MMPVSDQPDTVDYKQKYKTLKRKLKFLIYEQECFMEELRKAQRKLLKVARDRSFLLDRLLQYEKVDDSSSDSDATASSDSDAEGQKDGSSKRKKSQHLTPMTIFGEASAMLGGMAFGNMMSQQQTVPPPPYPGNQQSEVAVGQFTVAAATAASVVATATPQDSASSEPPKKKAKKKVPKASVAPGSQAGKVAVAGQPGSKEPGQMTREELERHLESRMEFKQHYMRIEKAPSALPMEIFSNENSNPDSEGTGEGGDDKDLVIDIPE